MQLGFTYINVHTHKPSPNAAIWALQSLFPDDIPPKDAPFSIGLHPWFLLESTVAAQWSLVREKAQLPNCLAIGECGLDRIKGPAMDVQLHWLAQQVAFAEAVQKPVVIHCVRAFDPLLGFLKAHKPKTPIIVHGFSQPPAMLLLLEKHGAWPSFGLSAMKNAKTQASLLASKRFFLETDTAAPEEILALYAHVSRLKQMPLEELIAVQRMLWEEVFLS